MHKRFMLTAAALLALLGASPSLAAAKQRDHDEHGSGEHSAGVQTVRERDVARQAEGTTPTKPWVIYTRAGGSAAFRLGPGSPPLGAGSLQLSTPTSSDKVYAFNYEHIGQRLADVSAIGYSTYQESATVGVQVPSINIEIDKNGGSFQPGDYATLVFEPVYNTDQGAVVPGTWQTWDAYNSGNARWWSTKPLAGGICAFSCYATWSQIIAANPDATILGGFGVNQGTGNPGLIADVDALTLNSTTYDFEPSRSDCKKGGWEADGDGEYRNQGDCVKDVSGRDDHDDRD